MLTKSDLFIEPFLRFFTLQGINVAFLVPTETGYAKSIMDATTPVRDLLSQENVHYFSEQRQGPEHKVLIKSYFVEDNVLLETTASLYRPLTKNGDPRIWFKDLKRYCSPYNLLAIIAINRNLYVLNLSNLAIRNSLFQKGFVYDVIDEAAYQNESIVKELLSKIRDIHNQGFIKSITFGDPGVGDTLENSLGIKRNNEKTPDYKGIELKSTRVAINGKLRQPTRNTLFAKVPDIGLTYREIVEKYGKIQIPRNSNTQRLQLYETCQIARKNAYDLQLQLEQETQLNLVHVSEEINFVSGWYLQNLKETLLMKHKETFWVKAVVNKIDNWEYFRYDKIIHTKRPNSALLIELFKSNKITVDLAAHITEGHWRDHGMLFKINPCDIPLLFPEPVEYDLSNVR